MKNKMKALFILVACSGMLLTESCGILGGGTQSTGTNGRLKKFSVTLGAQSNHDLNGFLNLSTGEALPLHKASYDQKSVDLIYAYGRNTKANLMVPSSTRVRLFGKTFREKVAGSWSVLNRGYLVNLGHGKNARKIYNKAKNRAQLIEAYEDAKRIVKAFPDYNQHKYRYGPFRSIRYIEPGDIIVFKSTSKGIYAIARVTGYKQGYSGSLSLDFKVSVK